MIVKKNITLSCWIACLRSQVTPVVMISVCFLEAKWKKNTLLVFNNVTVILLKKSVWNVSDSPEKAIELVCCITIMFWWYIKTIEWNYFFRSSRMIKRLTKTGFGCYDFFFTGYHLSFLKFSTSRYNISGAFLGHQISRENQCERNSN